MILVTTAHELDGYRVVATKGTAQGATFEDMLGHAEGLGANAILNADYDNELGREALFYGNAVVVELTAGGTRIAGPIIRGYETK
jgi:uncharacterized protein YbjQ (UPF0145 family)